MKRRSEKRSFTGQTVEFHQKGVKKQNYRPESIRTLYQDNRPINFQADRQTRKLYIYCRFDVSEVSEYK